MLCMFPWGLGAIAAKVMYIYIMRLQHRPPPRPSGGGALGFCLVQHQINSIVIEPGDPT